MIRTVFILIFLFPLFTIAQSNNDCIVKKDFLIIHSGKNYRTALALAKKASKDLNIKMDLRELSPVADTAIGLSLPYISCKSMYEDIVPPDTCCYIARGRSDDGEYISIEYSSAYDGFARGYYIVIVSSGMKAENGMKKLLNRVKTKFKDAYIKSSWVYVCCLR